MKVRESSHKRNRRRLGALGAALPTLVLVLALGCWLGAASALAEPSPTPPNDAGNAPEVQPVPDEMPSFGDPPREAPGDGQLFVAEIVDTLYTVGPAEFFALDMPADPPGARAVHLSGTVTVTDKKGDIIVRLFRAADYQSWLKKRGGDKAGPLWTSKKSRNVSIDYDVRPVGSCVLLMDNGYSMRTAKHLRIQLQIQYHRTGSGSGSAASSPPPGTQAADDLVTPRANTEEETPPPPPPPPDEGSN